MATIDGKTGVVTKADANTLTERVLAATARVSAARSGLSATRDAAVYQEAAEARQDYTYGYTGEYQLSAKAYYVDSSGALHDEPVPAEGGTAVLVPTYVIGLVRYLDGVEVDRPNLETGAVLDYMDYRTFDSEDDGWYWEDPYDGVLSYLAGWTHVATTNGGAFASGESMMQVDFGQAPVPVNQGDGAFDAYRVTPIRLRIPAGTMNGLEERTFELTDTVAIRQCFRDYGAVVKMNWKITGLTYTLAGVAPGGNVPISSMSDFDTISLVLAANFSVESTFESGHFESTSWWEAFGIDRMDLEDYGEIGTLELVHIDSGFRESYLLRKTYREWTVAEFKGLSWYSTDIQTDLGIAFYPAIQNHFDCEKVVSIDNVETPFSDSAFVVYPFGSSYWYMK